MWSDRQIEKEEKVENSNRKENVANANLNWYPGHMTKAKRMMQEEIKLVDLVIELVDARIPLSSRNPDIDELGKNKSRIVLLNKADLADEEGNRRWTAYFKEQGVHVLEMNSKTGAGTKAIHGLVQSACKEKLERDKKRGILNRPVRAMVVGIPNVGKSTFINAFAGRACAKTGNKPGVTKGKQWIRLNKSLELLDTPGILWPKFSEREVGLRLAYIGSMNDEIIVLQELALDFIRHISQKYWHVFTERYGVIYPEELSEEKASLYILEEIAENRKCYIKGGKPDYEKAASLLLEDFRSGRLGRITLEFPQDAG